MARRAHGQAVLVAGGVDALLAAVAGHDTRVVALASPNDPTGELFAVAELQRLLRELPDGVAVLLDEALVEFAGPQAANASLALLEQHPRLLVFRSFSKAWGLAGLRCGYALGGPGSEALLAELEPDLGVSEISQAAALEALRTGSEPLAKRVGAVSEQRALLTTALRERHFEVSNSQANFLWVAHPTLDGAELTARLHSAGILVAAGAALGEPRHIRVSLRDEAATTRLLGAIDRLHLSAPAAGE
jgi:histidinol-phosphate aminotransferase